MSGRGAPALGFRPDVLASCPSSRRRATSTGCGESSTGHIRNQGEECRPGDVLVRAGTKVDPPVLGLCAATGHDELLVRPRVPVRLVVTGDELLTSGLPQASQIRDALGPMLGPALQAMGAQVTRTDHIGDGPGQLEQAFAAQGESVLVCTGSTSRGPRDILRPLLSELGAELLVSEVSCRPGHPMLLAQLPDGRIVLGVPGNPLAAVVSLATLAEPLLAGMAPELGLLPEEPSETDTRLIPATWQGQSVPYIGSAMLRGAVAAQGLKVVQDHGVRWWPFPW